MVHYFLCLSNRSFELSFSGNGPHEHLVFHQLNPSKAADVTRWMKLNRGTIPRVAPLPDGYQIELASVPTDDPLIAAFQCSLWELESFVEGRSEQTSHGPFMEVRASLRKVARSVEDWLLTARPDLDTRQMAIIVGSYDPGGSQILYAVRGVLVAEALCQRFDAEFQSRKR